VRTKHSRPESERALASLTKLQPRCIIRRFIVNRMNDISHCFEFEGSSPPTVQARYSYRSEGQGSRHAIRAAPPIRLFDVL
jgi:hypothetical protein